MKKIFILFILLSSFTGFRTDNASLEVLLALSERPTKPLFSVNITDKSTRILSDYLYQSLIDYDPRSLELTPVLAEALPESQIQPNGEHHLKFRLSNVSKWDNRQSIRNQDVAFSLKLLFACGSSRTISYFNNFKRIELGKDGKSFTIVFYQYHFLNKINIAELKIYPAYIYDKKNVLDKYTIETIRTQKHMIDELRRFSENYLSITSSIGNICGSGAYELKKETDKEVIFERKKNWWCDRLSSTTILQQAHPKQIIYKILTEESKQLQALENRQLDVLNHIPPKKFIKTYLQNDSLKKEFRLFTAPQDVYSYIGLNLSHPMLDNKKVRQALAHLMNRQQYIDTAFYGLGRLIEHPFSDKVIDKPVKVYDFNIKKAIQLLKEAGWEDRNNNGTLDNAINSELQEFEFTLLYPKEAETSEAGCKIFQANCAKVGITVHLEGVDFAAFFHRLQEKDFDTYFGLWLRPTIENDIAQLFHSSTIEEGLNYCMFQNMLVDDLLEQLVAEPSFEKRKKIYQQLAEMIKDESPYIFLIAVNDRIAVRQSYVNVVPTFLGNGIYIPALY